MRTVGESASAAVLDGDAIRYIARVPTRRIMRVDITVGTRMPAALASMRPRPAGRPPARQARAAVPGPRPYRTPVPCAARPPPGGTAPSTRAADGHAQVDQELEEGLRSLSVPVRDADGHVVAAVNVAHHARRGVRRTRRATRSCRRCAGQPRERRRTCAPLGQWSRVG
ncbi:IclR family transcriptional regulator domain-containing protein [Yinghuangia aomiensis]